MEIIVQPNVVQVSSIAFCSSFRLESVTVLHSDATDECSSSSVNAERMRQFWYSTSQLSLAAFPKFEDLLKSASEPLRTSCLDPVIHPGRF